ncbi:MAG TPA: MFS transporter, partial [Desulfobacterales bacterium]|nr:MFS transporter [Desulfobacterales bacterium]
MKQSETGPNKWLIFSLVATGIFMSTLDGSIVHIALPAIMDDFLIPLATLEWIPMIYLLTVSSLLLSFGRLSDIRGRRWVYSRGLFVFSLGSLFCGMAGNATWLIAARSFQGVG